MENNENNVKVENQNTNQGPTVEPVAPVAPVENSQQPVVNTNQAPVESTPPAPSVEVAKTEAPTTEEVKPETSSNTNMTEKSSSGDPKPLILFAIVLVIGMGVVFFLDKMSNNGDDSVPNSPTATPAPVTPSPTPIPVTPNPEGTIESSTPEPGSPTPEVSPSPSPLN